MFRPISLVLTFFLLSIGSNPSPLPTQSGTPLTEMAERAIAGVVEIKGTTPQGTVSGSGFLISSDGTIVTCLHVIADMQSGAVRLSDGELYDSFTVESVDERRDLAIIQIAGFDLPYIEFGNSNDLKSGQQVLIIGSPLGLDKTLTTGIVSAIRNMDGIGKVIQTDAAANPGNSGGPLLNMSGEVVGVIDFKLRGAENLNFAIPINYVRGMVERAQESMSLDEMRQSLGGIQGGPFEAKKGPDRWLSLASGTKKVIRKDGDFLYVETELNPERKASGDFVLAELKLVGNKYVGVTRQRATCQYARGIGVYRRNHLNQCSLLTEIELEFVSPTRIEGRTQGYPQNTKYDCRKCSFSKKAKKVWFEFVWIPE